MWMAGRVLAPAGPTRGLQRKIHTEAGLPVIDLVSGVAGGIAGILLERLFADVQEFREHGEVLVDSVAHLRIDHLSLVDVSELTNRHVVGARCDVGEVVCAAPVGGDSAPDRFERDSGVGHRSAFLGVADNSRQGGGNSGGVEEKP